MSIQTEVNRIKTAKADIVQAIRDKGVTVPTTAKVGDLAALVSSIPNIDIETCTLIFDLASNYDGGGDIAIVYTDANGNTVEGTLPDGNSAYELTVACNSLFYMSGTDLYFGSSNCLSKLVEYRGKGVYRVTSQTGTYLVVFDNS